MPEEIFETQQPTQPVAEIKPTNWPKIVLIAVLGLGLLAGAAYAGYWYGTQEISKINPPVADQISKTTPEAKPTPTPTSEADQISKTTPEAKPTPTPTSDPTANWMTFSSKTEGFTIKYPNDWIIEDSSNTNCGHTSLNNSNCRDRYDFISPDGIRVRYVIHKDESEDGDRWGCGVQSMCLSDNVLGLEILSVQNFGQVYLVKLDKKVALHKPLSADTTPRIGENKHSDFMIDFNLPSKTGGRFGLFITTSSAGYEPPQLKNLTAEQFLNLKSVQQGILILKSLKY